MRMTKDQLIDAARTAAKYLPATSAGIMNELANRLDITSLALSESLEQRRQLVSKLHAAQQQIMRVPMPVLVPAPIMNLVDSSTSGPEICIRCNDGTRDGCSSCAYKVS